MRGRIAALTAVAAVVVVAVAAAALVLLPDDSPDPGRSGPAMISPATDDTPTSSQPTQPTRSGPTLSLCPRGHAERLTVLSLNIHAGRTKAGRLRLGKVASELREWDADLILLQEVDSGRGRTGGVDQARRLARALGYSSAYGPTRRFRAGSTGNAVLSRWPVADVGRRALPREPGTYRRGLVRVSLEVAGQEIDVYSTHLDHTSPALRRAQARAVAAAVRRSELPVVLGGDLNAEPGMPPVRVVEREGLVDGWTVVGPGDGLTVPAAAPRRRIDFVLADEAFVPVRSRVMTSLVSDHRAVMTTYDLLPQRCE